MLKRQRPSTPPPSIAEEPSYADPLDDGEFGPYSQRHTVKRRRTVAPALDGTQRGTLESVEEDISEGETLDLDLDSCKAGIQALSGPEGFNSEYKNMNDLLHRLHLEHQVRSQQTSILMYPQRTPCEGLLSGTSCASLKTTQSSQNLFPPTAHFTLDEENTSVRARYEDNNRYAFSSLCQICSFISASQDARRFGP